MKVNVVRCPERQTTKYGLVNSVLKWPTKCARDERDLPRLFVFKLNLEFLISMLFPLSSLLVLTKCAPVGIKLVPAPGGFVFVRKCWYNWHFVWMLQNSFIGYPWLPDDGPCQTNSRRYTSMDVTWSGQVQTPRPDGHHAVPLATSGQPTWWPDQKARVRICRLRKQFRELGQPISMSGPDLIGKRHEQYRVKWLEQEGPMKSRPGQAVKYWQSHSCKYPSKVT